MKVTELDVPGVLLIETRAFEDSRGWFLESWHADRYGEAGVAAAFVQDNVSFSQKGVLRGLHYQHPQGQAKLIGVLQGEVWDVAVDIRVGSATFGRWTGCVLSAANRRQLFIPVGFAHGFVVTSENALVAYKCSEVYYPGSEGTVLWNDPGLGIPWPIATPTLSVKDSDAQPLAKIPVSALPRWRDG